jgi:hypothetical protein
MTCLYVCGDRDMLEKQRSFLCLALPACMPLCGAGGAHAMHVHVHIQCMYMCTYNACTCAHTMHVHVHIQCMYMCTCTYCTAPYTHIHTLRLIMCVHMQACRSPPLRPRLFVRSILYMHSPHTRTPPHTHTHTPHYHKLTQTNAWQVAATRRAIAAGIQPTVDQPPALLSIAAASPAQS